MVLTENTSSQPLVSVHDLYRFYHAGDDETFALRGVRLTAHPGEFLVIIGPSGSGKSTLLSCIAGLDEPDGGHVVVAGQRITRRPEQVRAALRGRTIGILLQSGNLLEHLTVAQNVRIAQQLSSKPGRPKVGALLEAVGLAARASAYPSTLSGGESARAGLAVALANDPVVLLADEPTGELHFDDEQRVLELLRAHAAKGAALITVSHSQRVASAADRVLELVDGRVVDG
jgi:putative ABC transport system ATP-binding protein